MWEKIRDSHVPPRYHSGYRADDERRHEFLLGASLYGLQLEDTPAVQALADARHGGNIKRARRELGYRDRIEAQQLQMVDTLNDDLDSFAVEVPRRASKTTTIFCLLIGRCASRPDYQVTFSAQSGVAGSRRLREWAGRLDAINPPDDGDLPPWLRGKARKVPQAIALFGEDAVPSLMPKRRGFRVMRGEVGKGIYFDNGSQFLVLKPDADTYRGEGADVSWLDEFQEVEPDVGDELLAAILPLQDTKDDASIIVSGTAGEARVGPFWKMLERGRKAETGIGIIDFAAPEDTDWDTIADEDAAMQLLAHVHPGVGTLTTIEKMRKNYRALPLPQWAREYLSLWPETYGVAAIDAEVWAAGKLARKVPRPARVAFGFAVKPGGSSAAIVAAWRNARGIAYIEVVEHKTGTAWLPKFAQELSVKYRGSTLAYDDIGEGKASATEMLNLRPKPRLRLQTYRETAAGCVQFERELLRGRLKHFGQVSLDDAIEHAAKREVRGDSGVWLWTPVDRQRGDDITCLDAATRALRNWDQHYAGKTTSHAPIMGE